MVSRSYARPTPYQSQQLRLRLYSYALHGVVFVVFWQAFLLCVAILLGSETSTQLLWDGIALLLYSMWAGLAWAFPCIGAADKLAECRVVDAASGLPPSVGQVALRWLCACLTLPIAIGFLYALIDPQRRSLYDRIAGTELQAAVEYENMSLTRLMHL